MSQAKQHIRPFPLHFGATPTTSATSCVRYCKSTIHVKNIDIISYHSSSFQVLYASQHPRQVKLGLGVPHGSPVVAIREQLQADTGIPIERIVLAEITETGFSRVFCDSHPISSLSEEDSIYCIETQSISENSTNITLIVANVQRNENENVCKRFGTPFCLQVSRDVSYSELQKKLLKEMQTVLKSEVFSYSTPPSKMFRIRLQDVSADPDTYIEPTVRALILLAHSQSNNCLFLLRWSIHCLPK